mmetsp:Transcript_133027/g.331976  ORF Transcript_133027/g.331976 Transcript_133027/m.331976 type:complete len:200 (-) Transcript_133027:1860-2459(-)
MRDKTVSNAIFRVVETRQCASNILNADTGTTGISLRKDLNSRLGSCDLSNSAMNISKSSAYVNWIRCRSPPRTPSKISRKGVVATSARAGLRSWLVTSCHLATSVVNLAKKSSTNLPKAILAAPSPLLPSKAGGAVAIFPLAAMLSAALSASNESNMNALHMDRCKFGFERVLTPVAKCSATCRLTRSNEAVCLADKTV